MVGFLAGLGLARVWQIQFVFVGFVLLSLVVVRRRKRLVIVLFVASMTLFGVWRGGNVMEQAAIYDELENTQVTLHVTAKEDGYYGKNRSLTFKADDVVLAGQKLIGQIEVAGRGVNAVYAGDRLTVSGSLYRKRGLTQAGISFAQFDLISRGSSPIDSFRRNFATGLLNVLPEQLASFGLGLLIGSRNTLNEEINEELIAVGLIHIVAVSGYNLTVIINQVKTRFGRSRIQTLVFSLAFISVFLLMTAGEPSIVRAALVSSVSMIFWYFGRTIKPLLLLLLVAALTAGINPLYLWSSIGWYLSFAAFFGVLILSPAVTARFFNKHKENPVLQLTTETTAAQVCTLPIILYIFGRLSLVGILSNVLTGLFIPIAMLFTFLAGIAGMSHAPLAGLIAFPAKIVLQYILGIAKLLAKIPYANIEFQISLAGMITFVLVIALITWVLVRSQKNVIISENQGA